MNTTESANGVTIPLTESEIKILERLKYLHCKLMSLNRTDRKKEEYKEYEFLIASLNHILPLMP